MHSHTGPFSIQPTEPGKTNRVVPHLRGRASLAGIHWWSRTTWLGHNNKSRSGCAHHSLLNHPILQVSAERAYWFHVARSISAINCSKKIWPLYCRLVWLDSINRWRHKVIAQTAGLAYEIPRADIYIHSDCAIIYWTMDLVDHALSLSGRRCWLLPRIGLGRAFTAVRCWSKPEHSWS